MNENLCPVCGYDMEEPPRNYNICPSCGTEFGLSDVNTSILNLRQSWLSTGPRWWSTTDPQPQNWDPLGQLAAYLRGKENPNPRLQTHIIYLSEPVVAHQVSVATPESRSDARRIVELEAFELIEQAG